MHLHYSKVIDRTPYPKLGEDPEDKKVKNVWMFPDVEKSFPEVKYGDKTLINPHRYFITSGEALRKTEVMISDIRELMEKYYDNEDILAKLSDLLIDVDYFYNLLIKTKGPSKYLEVTKCEDGIYSGNICARKDPKKRKQ